MTFPPEPLGTVFPIKKSKKKNPYQNDTETLVLMWHACHNTIYHFLILRMFLLPLLCSMSLNSPNFNVKSIISNFGQGPFPKIAGKSPVLAGRVLNLFS